VRRFLGLWLVLMAAGALASLGVAFGVFRHFDLRLQVFAAILLVPVLQAALVAWARGASWRPARDAFLVVARDPLAIALGLLELGVLAVSWWQPRHPTLGAHQGGWLLHLATFVSLAGAAILLGVHAARRRVLLALLCAVACAALAADVYWPWYVDLAPTLWPGGRPPLLRVLVVHGPLTLGAFAALLALSSRLARVEAPAGLLVEAATAGAFAALLLVLLNGFMRPYLAAPYTGWVRTAASLGGLALLLAALRVQREALVLLRDVPLAALVILLAAPLWLLPWSASAALGRVYGRLAGLVWRVGWRTALVNLRRAYGDELDLRGARELAGRSFASLGQGIAEGVQFVRRHAGGRGDWRALYVAEDPVLEARVLADPRPKVFVTGHLGSWEVALMVLACLRPGGGAVARRVDNVVLDRVLRRFRTARPEQWIEKRGAVSEARRRLEAGDDVALLLDENGGYRGVFTRFFGRPASTSRVAALLALATGAPIVVGALVRRPARPGLLYRLALLEPEPIGDRPPKEAVRDLTQRVTSVLEQWIRDDPDQWRWAHWRWKTRPSGPEEEYGRREVRAAFGAPCRRAVEDGA
jgi:KDO2-lipid IV(A) lauroyltransferase